MKAPARSRKGRKVVPLSPAQAKRHQQLVDWNTKEREQRRLHPMRCMVLDLAVGIPITAAAIVIFLSYFSLIRW